MKYITKDQLINLAEKFAKSGYGDYLKAMVTAN
jgi:dTDP-glucose pyrophosphorylase